MGRRQIFFWITGSVLLGAGLLAVLVVSVMRSNLNYADWVEDSGLLSTMGEVFWLEDDRVFFSMLRFRDPSNPRTSGNLDHILAIWTPGTPAGAAEIYTEDYSGNLCYADGQVSYVQLEQTTGRRSWTMGRLGEERRSTDADRPPGTRYNRMACRREPWPERWAGQRAIVPLLPGHGWVAWRWAGVREPGETTFYPTADHPGIDLDLHVEDVAVDCFRWIVWRQAYFTDYCGDRMFLDYDRLNGIWLWPDGRVEVPELPPAGNVYWIWPVPAGWLVSINMIDDDLNLNDSGLYLWREGEFRLLIPGLVSDVAVTDDGCRAAFGHAPTFEVYDLRRDRHLRTLKIIDLCGYLDRILEEAPVFDPLARFR